MEIGCRDSVRKARVDTYAIYVHGHNDVSDSSKI